MRKKMLDGHLFGLSGSGLPRLAVCVSCLACALLLAALVASSAYNRAHTSRLLGSIPASPPPPLLVTSSSNSNSSASQSSSSSSGDPSHQQHQQHHVSQRNQPGQLLLRLDLEDPQTRKLRLPGHLCAHLLLLQVLIIGLVLSQSYHERVKQQQLSQGFAPSVGGNQLDPIGAATWCLAGALFYLLAAVLCWLVAQLVQLNLNLWSALRAMRQQQQQHCASTLASNRLQMITQQQQQHQSSDASSAASTSPETGDAATTTSSAQATQSQANVYGQQLLHHNNNSATSVNPFSGPAASAGSSQLSSPYGSAQDAAPRGATSLYGQQLQAFKPLASQQLQLQSSSSSTNFGRTISQLLISHLVPVVLTLGYVWFGPSGARKALQINDIAYVGSLAGQLASWPLLVDASATLFAGLVFGTTSVSWKPIN